MVPLCSTKGCLHDATVTPTILLWAAGYPKAAHQPMVMRINVPLCSGCAAHFEPKNFTTLEESRNKLTLACALAGKARPDFSTAELRLDPIGAWPGEIAHILPETPGRA